ncbi:uncharacterized protein LOC143536100 [Bidens hawaiensis]|uniref:uncharacterized protein LOC143536100 n=1 Tax=Bidens hawaiensis TaxID=980011 RepID=UPI00404A7174
MESPESYNRVSRKHSLSIMKHGKSGYEPSDTETELHEPPWIKSNKKTTELDSDGPGNLNLSRLTRRHSSKFDPPRRHSKSPYKTRKGDRNSKSPTPGPLPLPPGRSISPFSKSERRRRVSIFVPTRDDDLSDNDEESAAFYNIGSSEKPSYARTLSAPRLRSRDKDQNLKHDQRLKRREGRSRTPPSHRSITPPKDKEVEINETVANAKLVKSPARCEPVFDTKDSLPDDGISFSQDHAAVSDQNIKTIGLENRPGPDPKLFIEKQPKPIRIYKSNLISNHNTAGFNLRDVNGKSNWSYCTFTANRRKSHTDTWFSCIGCSKNSKKSPERLRAFDEASFIKKAFVVENLRRFWADKYQPLSLNEFTCHKQQALQLKQLVSRLCAFIIF